MIPEWFLALPLPLIVSVTKPYLMDPFLVAAIIQVESSGNSCATRYEEDWNHDWILRPGYYANKNKITSQTEILHQKTSWGLMQVMGAVARELGHEGPLVKLCDPEIGITLGVKKLAELKQKHGTLTDVVASYNAGGPRKDKNGKYFNQEYVDKVMRYYGDLVPQYDIASR